MVYKFFDKKTGLGVGASVNEELAQELHKPVINEFKRRNVCVKFNDKLWAADLIGMGSLSSKNGDVKYLLCDRCFHQTCLGQTFEGEKI